MKAQWKKMTMIGAMFLGQIMFVGMPLPVSAELIDYQNLFNIQQFNLSQNDSIQMLQNFPFRILGDLNIAGTLSGAGTIETPVLNVLQGGHLSLSAPLEVIGTGGVVMRDGSELMIGATPRPAPRPGGADPGFAAWAAVNLSEGWETENHTLYGIDHGKLTIMTNKVSGSTIFSGNDMVALGMTPAPKPLPHGDDLAPLLSALSITLESGSRLNFTFADSYVPRVGDMISLADVSLTIGAESLVQTNLGEGWIICNSAAIAEYVGVATPEPSTMLLFGTGLAGLAGFSLKRRKKQ